MVVAFPQTLPEPWRWCYLRYYQVHASGIRSGITTAMAALPQELPQSWQHYLRYHHSHGSGIPSGIPTAIAALLQVLPQPRQWYSLRYSHSHGGITSDTTTATAAASPQPWRRRQRHPQQSSPLPGQPRWHDADSPKLVGTGSPQQAALGGKWGQPYSAPQQRELYRRSLAPALPAEEGSDAP